MAELTFSVVIVTYNRKDFVSGAIKSVIEQTYDAHEIIVVVDGSEDGTADAIRKQFPDVIVHEQNNYGLSVGRNTGVALATGDWVCFLDDDDYWHRDKLNITATYLEANPECQALNNPVWFFTDKEEGLTHAFGFARDFVASNLEECHKAVQNGDPSHNSFDYLLIRPNSFRLLLERNRGVASSSVIKRDVLIRSGICCPMQASGDDWTMFLNVARLCEWHTIPQRLGFSRLHTNQYSHVPINGLYILAGQVNAWYTGRPFPQRVQGLDMFSELGRYGHIYKRSVQQFYWGAIKNKQFRVAGLIKQVGRLLLPKTADWIYAMTPPQITWRWEHHVLGMHK